MKTDIFDLNGDKIDEINLPIQFNEEIREDLIRRAVLAVQSTRRHSHGASPEAGKRASAKISRRRKDFKTAYGHGISRVPRKSLWHRGKQFGWVGAFAPGTVGGRRAHPLKSEKILIKKINDNERRKAIRSAISAGKIKVVDSSFESLNKTKSVREALEKLGLKDELKRLNVKIIRAGKGKSRGRKYRIKKGPLIIVSDNCQLLKSAINLQGLDVCVVNFLNAELLAPGGNPGRLAIWSKKSIEKLEKENLFLNKKRDKIKFLKKSSIKKEEGVKE